MKPFRLALAAAAFFALILAAAAQTAPSPAPAYRIAYLIREYDGAKLINARHYELLLAAPVQDRASVGRLRAESRVPFLSGSKEDYEPVGLDVDCVLKSKPAETGGLRLDTTLHINSAAAAGPGPTLGLPITRTLFASAQTFVALGRPTPVATLDDTASHHRIEIVVTVSPER